MTAREVADLLDVPVSTVRGWSRDGTLPRIKLGRHVLRRSKRPSSELYSILYSHRMARVVPFTEARGRLSELLDDVQRRHEHLVITRNGRPSAVVLAAEEYEALMESLEVLEDDDTMAALAESEQDAAAGRLQTLAEVKRDLGLG